MTTYTYSSNGVAVELYRQPRPGNIINGGGNSVVGVPDAQLPVYGWYPERNATPVDPARFSGYAAIPEINGNESVYAAIERNDVEQEAYLRTQKMARLNAYRLAPQSIDTEETGRLNDLSERAMVQQLALADAVGLAAVEAVEVDDLSAVPLSDAYVANVLSAQARNLVAHDDARISAGSGEVLSAADRGELDTWTAAVDSGAVEPAPLAVHTQVRVPDMDSGDLVITRVWEDSGAYAGWPGWYWSATCLTGNINALSLSGYKADGTTLDGHYPMLATDTPNAFKTHLQAGRAPSTREDFYFEVRRGSTIITPGKILFPANDDTLEFTVRW